MPDSEEDTHTHTHPNKTPLRSSLWLGWVLGQPVGQSQDPVSPTLLSLHSGAPTWEWLLYVMLEGGSEEGWAAGAEHPVQGSHPFDPHPAPRWFPSH